MPAMDKLKCLEKTLGLSCYVRTMHTQFHTTTSHGGVGHYGAPTKNQVLYYAHVSYGYVNNVAAVRGRF